MSVDFGRITCLEVTYLAIWGFNDFQKAEVVTLNPGRTELELLVKTQFLLIQTFVCQFLVCLNFSVATLLLAIAPSNN